MIGAGSVMTRNIPGGAMAMTRGNVVCKDGWATAFRDRQSAKKKNAAKAKEQD
jgi:bifunctional UDP-N-acetylglucosamine pyrophosphorylase/glucosamine-1-phosphate N-acetyltransferase